MKRKPDHLIKAQEKYDAVLNALEDLRRYCLLNGVQMAMPLPGYDSRAHVLLKSEPFHERAGYQTGDWVPSDVFYKMGTGDK